MLKETKRLEQLPLDVKSTHKKYIVLFSRHQRLKHNQTSTKHCFRDSFHLGGKCRQEKSSSARCCENQKPMFENQTYQTFIPFQTRVPEQVLYNYQTTTLYAPSGKTMSPSRKWQLFASRLQSEQIRQAGQVRKNAIQLFEVQALERPDKTHSTCDCMLQRSEKTHDDRSEKTQSTLEKYPFTVLCN